jgi:hypothetical protein
MNANTNQEDTMNITIKNIGNAHGTIGWLHKGLADKSLTLVEGHRKKDQHHGLWLKGPAINILIACYDYLTVGDCVPTENCYRSMRNQDARPSGLTDAAWDALLDIGFAWASRCNADEEQAGEQAAEIKIVRVEQ